MLIGASLHLNSDKDLKHLMSYGREFQYFGATTEKAFIDSVAQFSSCDIYEVIFGIESTYIDKFDYKTNYLQILICMKSIPIVFIYHLIGVYYTISSVYL